MKYASLFALLISAGMMIVLLSTFSNTVFSFTPEEEAVFEKALKSLQTHENQSIGSNFVQTSNKSGNGGLGLVNTFSFYDSGGFFRLTGEVMNNSPEPRQNIRAVAAYYDAAKKIIGTDTGYAYPNVLNTGNKAAFSILGPDPAQAKKIRTFKITLDGDYATFKSPALKISIGNHYRDQLGFTYTVVGEIINSGQDTASYIQVYGVFYDKKGKVLNTEIAYPAQSNLAPGQSTPFKLEEFELADKISSFKVYADSEDYSSLG